MRDVDKRSRFFISHQISDPIHPLRRNDKKKLSSFGQKAVVFGGFRGQY
jgi:hypothetical protein